MLRNFADDTTLLLINYQTMSMLRTFAHQSLHCGTLFVVRHYTLVARHYTLVDPLQKYANAPHFC
jgi:hypothetical protein